MIGVRAFIKAFDPKAKFYRSAVDGTLCVEHTPAYPRQHNTAVAHDYAKRIVRHKRSLKPIKLSHSTTPANATK